MISFNQTIEQNEGETVLQLRRAKDIVTQYGIHGVSGIGSLINIATIMVLTNRKFMHNFYDFLRCRCACNLVVCLCGIFFHEIPDLDTHTEEYLSLIFIWFAFFIPMRIALLASFISDNLLIVNRLATLYDRSISVFYKLSKKVGFYRFRKDHYTIN